MRKIQPGKEIAVASGAVNKRIYMHVVHVVFQE